MIPWDRSPTYLSSSRSALVETSLQFTHFSFPFLDQKKKVTEFYNICHYLTISVKNKYINILEIFNFVLSDLIFIIKKGMKVRFIIYRSYILRILTIKTQRTGSKTQFNTNYNHIGILTNSSIVLMGWSLLPNALRPFQDLLCSPEFRYNLDVNMLIKFCSEAYFFQA